MKMLVCLHGNPLSQEFDPLLPQLQEMGISPVIHKRPVKGSKLEPLLQSISATAKVSGGGPFALLAYSWGAYLAMAYMRRFPENVTGALFINPMLVDKTSISLPSQIMLATPVLRSLILRIRSRSMAAAFVKRIFNPEEPTPEVKGHLEMYLANTQIWRGVASYKKLMLAKPLPDQISEIKVPVHALFGDKDLVAPQALQMPMLQNLPKLSNDTLSGGGHALMWTHSDRILQEIGKLPFEF